MIRWYETDEGYTTKQLLGGYRAELLTQDDIGWTVNIWQHDRLKVSRDISATDYTLTTAQQTAAYMVKEAGRQEAADALRRYGFIR